MLLVWDFHVGVWRGTIIIYYLTAVFFVCIGFYKILIKLLLLYLLLLFNLHASLVIVGYNCSYNCKWLLVMLGMNQIVYCTPINLL